MAHRILKFAAILVVCGATTALTGAGVAEYVASLTRRLPDTALLAGAGAPPPMRCDACAPPQEPSAMGQEQFAPIETVPRLVQQAFIYAQDRRFYERGAGDLDAILANLAGVWSDGRLKDASTITQRVARSLLNVNALRGIDRPAAIFLMGYELEQRLTKERILEIYLNEIDLGLESYGVSAASLRYFGKPVTSLTLAEAAFIAGLAEGPHVHNPFSHAERALARRNDVLDRMMENGAVSPEAAAQAKAQPLGVNLSSAFNSVLAPTENGLPRTDEIRPQ